MQDAWLESPFQGLVTSIFSNRRQLSQHTVEEGYHILRGILAQNSAPESLWNTNPDRAASHYRETPLFDLVHQICRCGYIEHPLVDKFFTLAEETGARWDLIGWNRMRWNIHEKGRMTSFHDVIDSLGNAGAEFRSPAVISLLSRAVETGADWVIDDPNPPGRRRCTANVEELLLLHRRCFLRLARLLREERATAKPISADDEDQELVWVVKALVWLSPEKRKPFASQVLAFLPRVPPVLGYDTNNGCGPRNRGTGLAKVTEGEGG